MATEELLIQINLPALTLQTETQQEADLGNPTESRSDVRTTVFSLNKSPQVSTRPEASPPELQHIEIFRDGLDNPYLRLNWKTSRESVDRAGVVGFNIVRRKVSRKQFFKETRRGGEKKRQFSALGFDKISKKIPSYGKFSAEKKAIVQIKPDLIPRSMLNPQLFVEQSISRSRFHSSLNRPLSPFARNRDLFANPLDNINPIIVQGELLGLLSDRKFEKLAYISYDKFLAKESQKFVSVTDRNFVELSYNDKSVRYGEAYEYYIVSVTSKITSKIRSNSIRIFVEDPTPIRPPLQVLAKQVNKTQIKISVKIHPSDNVLRTIIYRRSEDEVAFRRVAVFMNNQDTISFFDRSVLYGKRYVYRIFLENIHGILSEPKEISLVSTAQGVTSRTRSNTFRLPILTATPDQNSDAIKLVISANDPMVSYYEIARRNLTIHEKTFTVPSTFTNYGGDGWKEDKIFVDRKRRLLSPNLKLSKDVWNRQAVDSSLELIDDTVQRDHIYQYRIVGRDLYGNKTPYALSIAKAQVKKSVRFPVNVRVKVLRGNPFRLKLSWDDDNLASRFSVDEVFKVESNTEPDDVKILYSVQRRKLGESSYDTFPLTANDFLIDEIPAIDNISFSAKKIDDTFSQTSNTNELPEKQIADLKMPVRPFNVPDFLRENGVYFYRVAAVDAESRFSNYTEELRVYIIPELSPPLEFKVVVSNNQVRPLVARLSWKTDDTKSRPDRWTIERKIDSSSDSFTLLGVSYIGEEFFDRNIEPITSYIYRIKSFDAIGRESDYYEARLTT